MAKFARDSYNTYLNERAGTAPTLEELERKHGVDAPTIDGKSVHLSRSAASNAEVFRAAKSLADEKGMVMLVDEIEQTGPSRNGSGGDEAA